MTDRNSQSGGPKAAGSSGTAKAPAGRSRSSGVDQSKLSEGAGGKWFAVDSARIMRLPERLRVLWPHELMPRADSAHADPTETDTAHADTVGTASAGEADAAEARAAGKKITDTVMLRESSGKVSKRGPDVLTAWLSGFAAELNLTRSRITIVISSGDEIAQLEVALCDDICLAILMLRGEGFEDFLGFELLRRLRPQDLGQVTEELCSLVEKDCVLTLTYLNEAGGAGMEFLHRVEGEWARPTLEREGETVTVGAEHRLESNAVRILLAATLTRLQETATGLPATAAGPHSMTGTLA